MHKYSLQLLLCVLSSVNASAAAAVPDVNSIISSKLMGQMPSVAILSIGSLPGGDSSAEGRGFSNLGLDWRGDCVSFDPNTAKPQINSPSTNYQVEIVNSSEQFASFMGISASAAMSYGIYSGSASAQYLKNVSRNSYSNYIAGKVTVYTDAAQLSVNGLSQLGNNALAAGADAFHRTCGDVFATSVVYGGEFIFILEINSRDDSEFESIQADLKAAAGNFGSASGQFSQSISSIAKKYNLTATILRNGLNEVLPDLTPASLEEYARGFPKKITSDKGIYMRPIRYGVRSYSTIDLQSPSFTEELLFLKQLTDRYLAAQKLASEIDYWNSHKDEFFYVDNVNVMTEGRGSALRVMQQLYDTAILCADKPKQRCQYPSGLGQLNQVTIPKRLRWVKLRVDGGRDVLGVVPAGETRRVRFRGVWSPSGGTTWWASPERFWFVHIIGVDGKERSFSTPTAEVARAGERVEVHLNDSPYDDNREHSTNPASAALY